MAYYVELKRVSDGKVVQVHSNLDWHSSSNFLWTEGNFACDCNRGQLFAKAEGTEDPNLPCSSDKYIALRAHYDGKIEELEGDE